VRDYLSGAAFGDAGRRVVIEEGLTGPELSLLAICDGRTIALLAPAQDFKRVGTGDVGPNTGGMGAYSPVPIAGASMVDAVVTGAIEPTLHELRKRGIATEVSPSAAKYGKQIRFAERRGIPFVWFPSPDGDTVKDIRSGEQVAAESSTWDAPPDDLNPKVSGSFG